MGATLTEEKGIKFIAMHVPFQHNEIEQSYYNACATLTERKWTKIIATQVPL